jgi:exosortase C (VPDSG-CTERM-specific)
MSKPLAESSEHPVALMQEVQVRKNGWLNPRANMGRLFCFLALLTLAFGKPLIGLIEYVTSSNLHSYILLVPIISGYLIYIRRHQLPTTSTSAPGLASIAFLFGLATLIFAIKLSGGPIDKYFTFVALSFLGFAFGGVLLFLGREWMSKMAFPMWFLLFMVPLPDMIVDPLETASKLASTEAANLFFNASGTPVLREGTIFQLPNITIEVAQECSGIRSSIVLILTSLVAANLFLSEGWRRAILVAFVIPLGIVRNGLRVWTIGTLCIQFGPHMINSIIHRRGGPAFFALSLIPFFAVLWWLRRSERRTRHVRVES